MFDFEMLGYSAELSFAGTSIQWLTSFKHQSQVQGHLLVAHKQIQDLENTEFSTGRSAVTCMHERKITRG